MKIAKDLTQGNIYKSYLLYALPLILSSLLSSLYGIVDAAIAGKFISEHALGAISATSSFDILLTGFFNGFAGGFSIYLAMLFGKGSYGTIKRDIVHMSAVVAAVSIGLSALAVSLRSPILDYLNVDAVLRPDAELYFVIYTCGYVLMFVNLILSRSLYALGVTSFSVWVSLLSAILNVGGNLLAVLVLHMGVEGLAISTLLSVATATVIYSVSLYRVFRELKTERVSYRFRFDCVKSSLRYTLPTAVQKMAFHATGIFIAPAINGLGADATTGYSVMTRMYNVCANSFWNTCSAVDCYTAQCVGKREHQKLRRGLWAGLWTNAAVLLPFALIFSVFAEPIASIFFPAGYVGVAWEYAILFFKVYTPFLYLNMLGHLMHSYLRSIGRVNTVLGITVFGSAVRVLATLALVPIFRMDGVYIGQVVSWAADAVLSVILYFALYHSERRMLALIERIHRQKSMRS